MEKKTLSLILVMMLLMGILSGCGSTETTAAAKNDTTAEAADALAADASENTEAAEQADAGSGADALFAGGTGTEDQYLRTGYGTKPIIVDYEKSMIDFAINNPEGYASVKDRVRILYPEPTIWNSHCIISFTDNGTKFIEALNDKEIQDIAFNRYGFRIGLSGGQYDVKTIGVDGLPQEIMSVVPGLKMDTYNLIIEGLKEVEF